MSLTHAILEAGPAPAETEFRLRAAANRLGPADEQFVLAMHARVFAWFASRTTDRSLSADLTQETFAAYWASLRTVTPRMPSVWLFRIARNIWRDAIRQKRRARRCADLDEMALARTADANSASEYHKHESRERDDRLVALVRTLPDVLSEVIVLRYWADLAYEEIARIQGVPALLVRWRAHRARRMLERKWTSIEARAGDGS